MSRECPNRKQNCSADVSEPDTPPDYAPGGEHRIMAKKDTCLDVRPARQRGRLKARWQVRVVHIDSQKYPVFLRDPEHPFALMAAEARIREIDSFCARLWARTKKEMASPVGEFHQAAA